MNRFKSILGVVLALMLILGLCACGETADNQTEGSTGAADTTGSSEQTEDTAVDETTSGIVYTVTVVDEGGNPISGAMVQICQGENCMPSITDEDGKATYSVDEEAAYEAKLMSMPDGYEYTTEETVFAFADGSYEITIVLKAIA